jgi:hypothetical protein
MSKHEVSNDPTKHELDEDWEGNNVAFTCPLCKKVFIVSAAPIIHGGERICPKCGKSTGHVTGGRKGGGRAWIEWVVTF